MKINLRPRGGVVVVVGILAALFGFSRKAEKRRRGVPPFFFAHIFYTLSPKYRTPPTYVTSMNNLYSSPPPLLPLFPSLQNFCHLKVENVCLPRIRLTSPSIYSRQTTPPPPAAF